ncbi:MAG: chlorite dismutase family protein [Acidimicrobiales bacterium]|nr:chlorite dismutase family protein [Acidimicrobiales bacterium]
MSEPLSPRTGLLVLHLFFWVPEGADREAVIAAVKQAQADGQQVVTAALLGHKADVGVMALGPDLWRLRALQSELVAAGLGLASSYVSLTEVSEYAAGVPEERKRARLYPELPPAGLRAFCFYPMSKRRAESHNWYTLPFDRRRDLMMDHGSVGRRFAGRVVQLVTGSTGLDDYEWGVTLFAAHPDDLKDVVHTMRFDRASALYAEFGPFYTGMLGTVEEVLAHLPLAPAG